MFYVGLFVSLYPVSQRVSKYGDYVNDKKFWNDDGIEYPVSI